MRTSRRLILFATTILALGAAAACEGPEGPAGDSGPAGSPGPQGSPGPAGANASRVVWKDKTGALPPFTVIDIGHDTSLLLTLMVVDTAGNVWRANPRTGALSAFLSQVFYFTTSNCTGTPYVEDSAASFMTPRAVAEFGMAPTYLVTPDDPATLPAAVPLSIASLEGPGGCTAISAQTVNVIPASAFVPVATPAPVAAPPLHPELVQ